MNGTNAFRSTGSPSVPSKRPLDQEDDDDAVKYRRKSAARSHQPPEMSTSVAARMMAKMGYKPGEGLGAAGQGMVNPIDVKLRPQGAGLGAVREKTKQAKEEEYRAASLRGEVLDNSSEEERSRRNTEKLSKSEHRSASGFRKSKIRYRTAAEIEVEAEGLEIPNVLKSLVDLTGREQRLLTSTAGLLSSVEVQSSAEEDTLKIAKRARRDLEAFAEVWKGLGEEKLYLEMQERELDDEADQEQERIRRLHGLIDSLRDLGENLSKDVTERTSLLENDKWETLTSRLESLGVEYRDEIDQHALSEVIVAVILPLFRSTIESWEPLHSHTSVAPNINRLRHLLDIRIDSSTQTISLRDAHIVSQRRSRSTTDYESMIYTVWLPKVRSTIINDWDVYHPSDLISLIDSWRGVLPPFVYANVVDQLIAQRLATALAGWNPKRRQKKGDDATRLPHTWLFPWLPYLDAHHLDPKHTSGLLGEVRRKFRVVLETLDLTGGVLDGLIQWKEILKEEFDKLLIRHLLPRLAMILRNDLEIDPSSQDLKPLKQVLQWKDLFRSKVLGQLLVVEFFPKWMEILHHWLTSEPNYEEVGQWFTWWKGQIPLELNQVGSVTEAWERGLALMNCALDLGSRAATELLFPELTVEDSSSNTPVRNRVEGRDASPSLPAKMHQPEEATFRDVVEFWCSQENVLIIPIREAHGQTGLPLFRITASANGKGGVLVYFKGDVLWAHSKKDKDLWEPIGLGDDLVDRAEGK